jgi:hypothetical protein
MPHKGRYGLYDYEPSLATARMVRRNITRNAPGYKVRIRRVRGEGYGLFVSSRRVKRARRRQGRSIFKVPAFSKM